MYFLNVKQYDEPGGNLITEFAPGGKAVKTGLGAARMVRRFIRDNGPGYYEAIVSDDSGKVLNRQKAEAVPDKDGLRLIHH